MLYNYPYLLCLSGCYCNSEVLFGQKLYVIFPEKTLLFVQARELCSYFLEGFMFMTALGI